MSQQGTLAYEEAGGTIGLSEVAWVDRTGKKIDVLDDPADFYDPRISPDGRRVAVVVGDPGDIWIYDVVRHIRTRMTFAGGSDNAPTWSPDGSRVAFSSQRSGNGDLYARDAAGTGSDELLLSSKAFKVANSWSPDGIPPAASRGARSKAVSVFSPFDSKPHLSSGTGPTMAALSPDGRWLAYASDESGRFEIYVMKPPPEPGGKWQVSTAGGVEPRWRRDGKELFYVGLDGRVMAVEVGTGADFEVGKPQALFGTSLKNASGARYDVAPRPAVPAERPSATVSPPITLVRRPPLGVEGPRVRMTRARVLLRRCHVWEACPP